MGVIAEMVGAGMLGQPLEFNWLMILIRVDGFHPMSGYRAAASRFAADVYSVPPAAGFDRVELPGEPETRRARDCVGHGVPLPPPVWTSVTDTCRPVAVAPEVLSD